MVQSFIDNSLWFIFLTFESKSGLKKLCVSLDKSLIELTERLGYQFVKEYKSDIIIWNRQVSGEVVSIKFWTYR
jgi:hypothetical protein